MKKKKLIRFVTNEKVICKHTYGTIIKGETVIIKDRTKIRSKKCATFYIIVQKCNGLEQKIPTKYLKKIK